MSLTNRIHTFHVISLLFLIFLLSTAVSVNAGSQNNLTVLEDLTAELYNNGRIVSVKGAVRNISKSSLRGFITIYVLGEDGEMIEAQDEPLADGRLFTQGSTVDFKSIIKIPLGKKIKSISVDFTRK